MKKALFYLAVFIVGVPIIAILALFAWPEGSLEKQLQSRNVPALAFATYHKGKPQKVKVTGELAAGRPAPEDAIFNVASLTKPVFAVVALKLIDRGVLGLDDPLYPHWVDPDLTDDDRHKQLTARMILSHQTGFPNWRWHTPNGKLTFLHDPGTQYGYSGEGYHYLMQALENLTGSSLAELADSLLFQPLGMEDTYLIWTDDLDETRFAHWHDKAGQQYEINKRQTASAADDLMTTVADYSTFCHHVMAEQAGLSPALYQEMIQPQVKVSERVSMGLGWELVQDLPDGAFAMAHGGSDQGVRAQVVLLPKAQFSYVGFTNGDCGRQLIDRQMVKHTPGGATIISKLYAPVIWRVIYFPFSLIK